MLKLISFFINTRLAVVSDILVGHVSCCFMGYVFIIKLKVVIYGKGLLNLNYIQLRAMEKLAEDYAVIGILRSPI